MGNFAQIIKDNAFVSMGTEHTPNKVRLEKTYLLYDKFIQDEAEKAIEEIERLTKIEDLGDQEVKDKIAELLIISQRTAFGLFSHIVKNTKAIDELIGTFQSPWPPEENGLTDSVGFFNSITEEQAKKLSELLQDYLPKFADDKLNHSEVITT